MPESRRIIGVRLGNKFHTRSKKIMKSKEKRKRKESSQTEVRAKVIKYYVYNVKAQIKSR